MRHWHRILWIGLYVVIVAVNLRILGKPESALPLKDFGRDGSVNSVLEQTLDVPHAAEQITAWLDGLPRGRAILVITPSNNMSASIAADLVSYLAWPRRVDVSSDPEKSRQLLANARGQYCAVGLCYMEAPPSAKISQAFGRALVFISTEAK